MKHQIYIYAFLAAIIFSSGCVGGGNTKTEVISEDLLVIKEPIDVFPSKNVRPDDTLIVRMEVQNRAQKEAYLLVDTNSKSTTDTTFDGDYLLIDHCETLYKLKEEKMTVISKGKCATLPNNVKPLKSYGGTDYTTDKSCYIKISPGQSHTFQWKISAPSEEAISKMASKCDFKFQAAYAATAQTDTYIYFASPLEVAQRLYTSKDMTLSGDNIATYGPVAINFQTGEPQPISGASKDGDTWNVYLNVKNLGNGIADITGLKLISGDIKKAAGKCRFFEEIEADRTTNKCTASATTEPCKTLNTELDTLKKALKVYSTASSRIMCELVTPKVQILTPFKFTTVSDYTYSQTKEIPIKTIPIKELA